MATKSTRPSTSRARKKKKIRPRKTRSTEIVIDRQAGYVFKNEKEMLEFFGPQVERIEADHQKWLGESADTELGIDAEDELDLTLEEPQEIWHDPQTFKEFPIFHFIRPLESVEAYQVAVTYVSSEDEPTFLFLHFVTADLDLVNRYRRGELIYDRAFEEVGFGALDGDALSEGDPLAMGLFISMLKVRADKDIAEDDFKKYGEELREETIENADEIWKNADLTGNQIVTFIREFPDHEIRDMHYIAVTQEDPSSKVHSLLFSFPTSDLTLVDRYRHGENLQAEEVTQESSH
ncbi:MAG: peptidase [Bdellovibrionaceae bacterium]|nr:peptidase [Pseudobdellovibrionaceae bacterium]